MTKNSEGAPGAGEKNGRSGESTRIWHRFKPSRLGDAVRMALMVATLALLPAAVVIGANEFSDVPPGHLFYNAISALYGARITTGCQPGLYCPEDPVTRGQMAAFLHRGLPRAQTHNYSIQSLTASDQNVVGVVLKSGGVAGGQGFVKIDGSLSVRNQATTGCPCTIRVYVEKETSGIKTHYTFFNVYNAVGKQSGNGMVDGWMSGAVTGVFQVPSDTSVTFWMKAQVYSAQGLVIPSLYSTGVISAVYVPFSGGGTNQTVLSPDQETSVLAEPNGE